MGERFPANPEHCDVELRYGDLSKAMELSDSGYVQIGNINVTRGGDSFDDAMKARVRPQVCKLGGTVATMGSSSEGSFSTHDSYVSLMIFRKTDSVHAANPAGKPGS